MESSWKKLTIAAALAAVVGLAGCEGDDGDDGDPGPQGEAGLACWDLNGNGVGDFVLDFAPFTEDINDDGVFDAFDCNAAAGGGGTPSTNPVESCSVCHSSGSIADAVASHALPPIESVSNVSFAVDGDDLDVTFDIAVDGETGTGYDTIERGYRNNGTNRTDICNAPSRGDPCDPASLALADNGGGNYTITVFGGAAEAAADNRYVFRVAAGTDRETRVYFFGDYVNSPFDELQVSAEACTNCHGPEGIDVHGGYFAAEDGGEPCLVCHGSDDVPSLAVVAHGYHSSIATWEDPIEPIEPHVTFPTYMNNCSVCHATEDQLTAVNSMPVIADACFSCHGSTATMFEPDDPLYTSLHQNISSGCETCHVAGGPASSVQVVTDAHNGLTTERSGIIWDGVDTSVTEGAKFDVRITNVADDGTNLTITWEADYDGAGVDPCNDTVGASAPVFFLPGGGSGGTWSVLRNYAQGGDFILGIDPEAAGQPESVNLTAENTTCSGNVATTVVPVEDTDATVGRVGLQGKPGVVSVADATEFMRVRAKSATYDWVIGEGGAAPARRAIVDTTGKCLKCHVGSLYQHGGNRVDNVDLCILCHNSAANDKYVRVGYGVDASEAYDGQAGELFEMKTMLHAVHPSGHAQIPFVIYRGRGIYAWAEEESLVPNWPGTGPDLPIYGSDDGTGNPVLQTHNFHAPTYPRGLYDCAACHTDDFATLFPDATKAMASTVDDAGDGSDWSDLIDDVLEGASSASCMSCHKQWSAADRAEYNALGSHAAQNGWVPQEFPEGRQTIIDAN